MQLSASSGMCVHVNCQLVAEVHVLLSTGRRCCGFRQQTADQIMQLQQLFSVCSTAQ